MLTQIKTMEKSKAEIEQSILEFLKEHGENCFTSALTTCFEGDPPQYAG